MVLKTRDLPLAGLLFREGRRKGLVGRKRRGPFRLESLEARVLLAADPIISEFMARNRDTLADEDGAYSDWIEIYNRGDAVADLSGYYLANDAGTPTQWQIPAGTTLAAGQFLTVFASGKDRAVAASELHTNFELDALGGFVGLFASDGSTPVSQYDAYPALGDDQSYGVVRPAGDATYFTDGSPGKVLIPTDDSLGDTWTGGAEPFDDSAWLEGPSGFGFETQPGTNEFSVTVAHSTVAIENLASADSALSGMNATLTSATAQVINYFDTGGGGANGNFAGDVQFPGGGGDDIALRATAPIFVTPAQAGTWTFGVNSDDGSRLRIDGATVINDDATHAPEDRFGTATLAAGLHTLELTFFERSGGAEVELFAAPGNFNAFNGDFTLVGDPAGNLPLGGLEDFFQTDLESAMTGGNANASAYFRLPFDVDDPADVQSLQVTLSFDDGFAASLNGQPIDSRNAPASLTFDASAVEQASLTTVAIDLTPYRHLLRSGENILAVQGLNASAVDPEFLIRPVITGRVFQGESIEAFNVPTPGSLNGRLDPLITEFQASNRNTLADEDGSSSDWIEIYNPGQVDVDLAGWYLTDNPTRPTRWQFPTTYLPAGGYLVVFASSKNRAAAGGELHTNFKLSAGGEYLALVKPDGTTRAWEYEPGGVDYRQQYEDVSYGLAGGSTGDTGDTGDDAEEIRGLVAYWDFEDGPGATTLTDKSGNGVDGVLNNMESADDWIFESGAVGSYALAFDGIDDVVETGVTASELGIGGNAPRTVTGWARAVSPSTEGGVFEVGLGDGNDFALRTKGTSGLLWQVEHTTQNTGIVSPIDWFPFAITYDGTDVFFYVNGSQASQTLGTTLDTNDDGTFKIGSWAGNFFRGDVDDLAVWDFALPVEDIQALANRTLTPLTVSVPVNRPLGTTTDGFSVRQVNASPDFAGIITGEIGGDAGSGIDPLRDADDLLALSAPDAGIAGEVTFSYDEINFFDTAGGGTNGLFGQDEPFPLDAYNTDDDHFALQATATLIVPAGEDGEFILGFNSDEGGRLRIDGVEVIVDNTLHLPTTQTAVVNLTEGEHALELTFFERDGGSEVELFYASAIAGAQDGDFQLLTILPSQQPPAVPPSIYQAPRGFFPEPTPGAENTAGVETFVAATTFSSPGGYYEGSLSLTIDNATPGVAIRYTTDGSAPTAANGTVYTSPLTIDSTTILRAAAFLAGAEPSDVATASYFFLTDVVTQSPGGETPAGFPAGNPNGQRLDYGIDPDIVGVDPPAADEYPAGFAQFKEAMEQIQTISMVTDSANLFDTSTGIYVNATQRGRAWERPASLELIDPAGTVGDQTEFQIDAGVRIRGGYSRRGENPKHSFSLFFRSDYGASKLDYPLFGDEGVDEFDSIGLRTAQNYSWAFFGDADRATRSNLLRDIFSRDLMRELGQPYTRGRYYHLYLNGQYWGIYQTEERPDAAYAETNLGGAEDDYDVVKNSDQLSIEVADGSIDAYQRLADFFYQQGGLGDANMDDYYRAQGMNPDGTPNPDFERLLNVDSLIDYMIVTYFTADLDGPGSRFTNPNGGINNYFAIYNRENPDGWQFLEHDSEISLDTADAVGANYNVVTPFITLGSTFDVFNAHWMHQELANGNSVYRQRFADRVYEVFFNDGALTPENATALLDTRTVQIDKAIYAESARWGDAQSAIPKTIDTWNAAVTMTRDWLVDRIPNVLEQFRVNTVAAGGAQWYPDVDPPVFDPTTGEVAADTLLSLTIPGEAVSTGTVYYTTDGTDPRALDGQPSATAIAYDRSTRLSGDGDALRYMIPTDGTVAGWQSPGFDDASWNVGTNGLGFDQGPADGGILRDDVFLMRVINPTAQPIPDIATATGMLDGTIPFAGTDVEKFVDFVNHGTNGTGDFGGDLLPSSLFSNTDEYALRVTANVTIPMGIWTLAVGSNDGFRLTVDGVVFTNEVNTDFTGVPNPGPDDVLVYGTTRSHGVTLGTFTLDAPLATTLQLDFFENTGGDDVELSLAPGEQTSFNTTIFDILQDSVRGWQIAAVDRGVDYTPYVNTDVGAAMLDNATSAYLRIPFTATDVDQITRLTLRVKYDDGFTAYLNGSPVAVRNAPTSPNYDSTAFSVRDDNDALEFEYIDLNAYIGLLNEGENQNLLAIHAMNQAIDNTDFLIIPELSVGYAGQPLTISQSGPISARSFDNGQWSPLRTERFLIGESTLAISEIHYHPAEPTMDEQLAGISDADLFEFIEIVNVGTETVDMGGIHFTEGITFDFTGSETVTELAPGERAVVVRNLAAYQMRFGTDVTPAGVFSGFLDNAGERIALSNALGQPIVAFAYADGGDWPGRADGDGFSLEMIDPFAVPPDDPQRTAYLEDGNNWRASRDYQGSPGQAGLTPRDDVVVNEVLGNTDSPGLLDAIELFNTSESDVDVGGWYLSDSTDFAKYRIPDGTVLPAGGYLVFDENDFNPQVPDLGQIPFGLSGSNGDDVWLMEANAADGIVGFVDHVDFGAAVADESFGRWPNGQGPIVPMLERTFGGYNAGPRVGPVIISEVMYHPYAPTQAELDIEPTLESEDFEFVELFNPTGQTLDISGWRLDNAVAWVFPAGTVLAPGQVRVAILFDPATAGNSGRLAAFRVRYPDVPADAIIGGWSGRLNNAGEPVQLERPDTPVGFPPVTPYVPVDLTRYDDTGDWPAAADGFGDSLSRTGIDNAGTLPGSWAAQNPPTPGSVNLVSGRYVFYNGSVFDTGAGLTDDDAIAVDKSPLLPGQRATSANYTSYSAGINGLMIDLFGLSPATPTAADFQFRTGNGKDPALWGTPDAPANIDVRRGEGVGGADRVVITWPDGEIRNTWLEVTVLATTETGLLAEKVFYFGNAVAETGNAAADAMVNAADVIGARDHPRSAANSAGVTDRFDLNRDGYVDAVDMVIARDNAAGPLAALRLILPLPSVVQEPGRSGEGEPASGRLALNFDVGNGRPRPDRPADLSGWIASRSKIRDRNKNRNQNQNQNLPTTGAVTGDWPLLLDGELLGRLATELAGPR